MNRHCNWCGNLERLSKHHLSPKMKDKRKRFPVVQICMVCHRIIHEVVSNSKLRRLSEKEQNILVVRERILRGERLVEVPYGNKAVVSEQSKVEGLSPSGISAFVGANPTYCIKGENKEGKK